MSKVFIIFEDEQLRFYYDSLLSSFDSFDVDSFSLSDPAEALLLSTGERPNLIVCHFHDENTRKLVSLCQSLTPSIPVIITSFKESISEAKAVYKSTSMIHYSQHGDDPEQFALKVQKLSSFNKRARRTKEYCKVALNFFFSAHEVFCDVYLQINNNKYIKVLNRYQKIDHEDLKKYEARNIRHLFVKERDFKLITKQLIKQLRPIFNSTVTKSNSLTLHNQESLDIIFPIQLQETVGESISRLGLSPEAVEMTSYAVSTTMSLVEKNLNVMTMLKKSMTYQNYISEHSFMLSYLSCSVLNETNWEKEAAHVALTLAAFFHDINFKKPELAKVQKIEGREFDNLGLEERSHVKSHSQEALKVLEEIEGIPPLTMTIVEQHHEQFDGSGFPKGIDYRGIHKYSVLFNLSHQLTQFIYETDAGRPQIREFINDLLSVYSKGFYPTVIQAMRNVFQEEEEKELKKKMTG